MTSKQSIKILLTCILLLPTVAANAGDLREHQVDPAVTKIMGIPADASERDIIKALGKPKSVKESYNYLEEKPSRNLYYEEAKIYIVDDNIYGFSCFGLSCMTEKGIKVGDPRAKVVAVYGSGNPPYPESARDTLSYPLTGRDIYLVFVFKEGKVAEIEFFMDFA